MKRLSLFLSIGLLVGCSGNDIQENTEALEGAAKVVDSVVGTNLQNVADKVDDIAETATKVQEVVDQVQSANQNEQGDPSEKSEVQVLRMVDGDTAEVMYKGKKEKVRFIGCNTPETKHPTKGIEKYGKEAYAYSKKRLEGQTVHLEFDVEQRDKYGRLLPYVWLGEEMFNRTLIKEGYAQVMTIQPNVRYADEFVMLQKEARENNRGLWGSENEQPKTPANPPTGKPAPAPKAEEISKPKTISNLKYDPHGPDRDCGDFSTYQEAYDFFIAAGGPEKDPHRLDREGDGIPCESLKN